MAIRASADDQTVKPAMLRPTPAATRGGSLHNQGNSAGLAVRIGGRSLVSGATSGESGLPRDLDGAGGNDTIVGDAGQMKGTAVGGNDVIIGGAGDDPYLIGDLDGSMSDNARGGNDQIWGGIGVDFLFGDFGDTMSGSARGGNDYLNGGDGNDLLSGDAYGEMSGQARGGDDHIYGGVGDDKLFGENYASFMTDEAKGGNDYLDGGPGDDEVHGDFGFLPAWRGSRRKRRAFGWHRERPSLRRSRASRQQPGRE